MSRYIIKTILCTALAVPALVSCELDQYPETSLPTERAWSQISDATFFNVGLQANLRSVTTSGYAVVSEAQADLFNVTQPLQGSYLQMHNWQFTSTQADGDGVWQGNYGLIANANNVINNIDRVPAETEEDKALLHEYKATGYFARAFGYANMVTRYCQNYDSETAAQTLGLPLVLDVDVNAKPERASLADTYKRIIEDLDSAEVHFIDHNDVDVTKPNYYTTKALKARVYLQMKEYGKAIDAAKTVMAAYPLIKKADDYASMWAYDEGSEIIFQPLMTPDERSGWGTYISYDVANACFSAFYIPTQGLMNLYENNDYRKDVFFVQTPMSSGTVVEENGYILAKFPGNEALLKTGEAPGQSFYNMTKVFRVPEMYLIAAESQYNLDGTDGGYLKTLRQARGASDLQMTGAQLFAEIKNEWAREFCGEGFRLDCLKRWGQGFTRMAPQQLADGFLYNLSGVQTFSITPESPNYYKMVWEIPFNDRQANKNLKPNWNLGAN